MQIERVTALLEEVEDISGRSSELGPAGLARAHAGTFKARQMLDLLRVAQSAPALAEDEGDPQPYVDWEVLERVFHSQDLYQ